MIRRLMRRLSIALSLSVHVACAGGPSAAETLPKLRSVMEREVATADDNADNSKLVEQVSRAKHLHGMTRSELADQLGPGEPCSRHPICAERGFSDMDRYYEVGRPGGYVRYRPALIVGFSRFGKVERTFVLRVQ